MNLLKVKQDLDYYFGLEDDLEGQFLYYGAIGTMALSVIVFIAAKLL